MHQIGRPKNFDKILAVANEMLSYMRDSDDKTWGDKYEQQWYEKLEELQSLVFANKQLRDYLSPEDLREHFLNVVMYLNKSIKDITNEDCERYNVDPLKVLALVLARFCDL